ncbi:MAG: beta-glucosidase BglX [Flavobacteriaceae bacterium]|nr:beta-glucosidase BglX [Flavobacteriaceae bacterium]|tara:strand:- start:8502 stop:10781 length:2280 start_codon:yes stop_codon:yes gene_type:complete
MNKLIVVVSFILLAKVCYGQNLDQKIEDLLSQMSLTEKIGQMNQYNGFWNFTGPQPISGDSKKKYDQLRKGLVGSMLNVRGTENVKEVQRIAVEESRLGIPLLFGFDVIHGYKTQSPIPLAESASWDIKAIERSARLAALEASSAGLNWTFAPMVDISRDSRWGRVMEGAGEDPFLASMIASARVKGFQGNDLSKPNTILACAKHFAGYGYVEAGRDYNTTEISLNTLHNVVLPPFKAAADSGVGTFMNSFNDLNGIPSTADKFLQRKILKELWKFKGFVVSDWGSIREMIDHGFASDRNEAGRLAILGGSDMDMESSIYIDKLEGLVNSGKISIDYVDDSVRRILRAKFLLGLFDDPYRYIDSDREEKIIGSKEILEGALDIAKKSIVLLKNENNLLPLKKKGQKIALIGPLAADKNSPLGNWSIAADKDSAISVLEALSLGIMRGHKGNDLIYKQGVRLINKVPDGFHEEVSINENDRDGIEEAVIAAKEAEIVIMVLGEYGYQSGEGRSRVNLNFPGLQQELLERIREVNKNIILVVMSGRPLILNWADENIPAIVQAWHLGTQSGYAISEVLYGDYNPSGKLTMSFPRSVGQMPLYYSRKSTGRPGADGEDQGSVFWSHYQDEKNTPLYPFGYGLSYTKFRYSQITLTDSKMSPDETINAEITITNTGKVKGKEVVQMYIHDRYASATRPVRELKGFQIVELEPRESKTVAFKIDRSLLEFYSGNNRWEAESGDFDIYIGTNSNTKLKASFVLND